MSFALPRVVRLENNNNKSNLEKKKIFLLYFTTLFFATCVCYCPCWLQTRKRLYPPFVAVASMGQRKRGGKRQMQHGSELCLASVEAW